MREVKLGACLPENINRTWCCCTAVLMNCNVTKASVTRRAVPMSDKELYTCWHAPEFNAKMPKPARVDANQDRKHYPHPLYSGSTQHPGNNTDCVYRACCDVQTWNVLLTDLFTVSICTTLTETSGSLAHSPCHRHRPVGSYTSWTQNQRR